MLFWIEFGLSALAIALAYACPNLGASWFERAEQVFRRLAHRRALAVLSVGLAALAARAALLPILPVPQPAVNDEFGYLLLADTFAHGRLTNPTHPMWIHFESIYIIWQPTYTAQYYPAQGLIMALGQSLVGHPFWGVWLSLGLMCAAICWMLQGWLPPGWALLGGFLAVVRLATFSYWANSYWGGAVAATGGALVLGALPRIKQAARVPDALLMGLGFAIVANSRPYEGLFFGLPIAGRLVLWMFGKSRPNLWLALRRVVAPLVLVLGLTACAMGYYFWRTTGSPWDTPFLVNERTYNLAAKFPWQSAKPALDYHHPDIRDYYRQTELRLFEESRSFSGRVATDLTLLVKMWEFYLGPVLTLPLLLALATLPYGFTWRNISPETRFLLLACGVTTAGSMLPHFFSPHYDAAITCAILALVLIAMKHLWAQRREGKAAGPFITRAVPLTCLLLLALRVSVKPLHLPEPRRWLEGASLSWCALGPANAARADTLAVLQRCPGRQLAIVRYSPHHNMANHEWVYNEADIDHAKVIWARDMGPARNKELIDYFRDRRVWLVEADEVPPRVLPYSASP